MALRSEIHTSLYLIKMRRVYLIYAFTAFLAWLILNWMKYQFKWIVLGFGVVMLLLGVFMKNKVLETKSEVKEKEAINNLNKKEAKKNDI